jgi:hypothetical protein
MATSSRKPVRKSKPPAEPFFSDLDSEAEAILELLDAVCNARADTADQIDQLQLRYAQHLAVADDVLFLHAEAALSKPSELETLARAQFRAAAIDTLLARAWSIESGPARKAWCTLLQDESKKLFADEATLRELFKPADRKDLHRAAAKVREAVAAAFG